MIERNNTMAKKNKNQNSDNQPQETVENQTVAENPIPQNQDADYIQQLEQRIKELEQQVQALPRAQGSARKKEVLAILNDGPASIKDIAIELETSTRNVSSVLTGLRKDGYIIHTDEHSRKYLISSPTNAEEDSNHKTSINEVAYDEMTNPAEVIEDEQQPNYGQDDSSYGDGELM